MASIYSVADFIDMLRRRMWLILVVTMLGCVASVWMALQQQPVYSSTEVIQITRPKIAGELARSTADGSSARRIQLIEQRLMARGTILEIVDQLNLFADRPGLLDSEIVPMMRTSVSLMGTAAVREGSSDDGAISVLTITANMPTREQAQAVAREFSKRTIALSQSTRLDQARETLLFFDQKEKALVRDISALEEEIANFRYQNEVTLPGAIEMRGTEIAAINESLLELARQEIELRKGAEEAEATQREAYARRVREEFESQLETLTAQRQLLLDRRAELEASLLGFGEDEEKAIESLKRAYFAADRGGDDWSRARIATDLMETYGYGLAKSEAAAQWEAFAKASIDGVYTACLAKA